MTRTAVPADKCARNGSKGAEGGRQEEAAGIQRHPHLQDRPSCQQVSSSPRSHQPCPKWPQISLFAHVSQRIFGNTTIILTNFPMSQQQVPQGFQKAVRGGGVRVQCMARWGGISPPPVPEGLRTPPTCQRDPDQPGGGVPGHPQKFRRKFVPKIVCIFDNFFP